MGRPVESPLGAFDPNRTRPCNCVCSRRLSSAAAVHQEAVDLLDEFDHVLQIGDSPMYYLWLNNHAFDILSHPYAAGALERWLSFVKMGSTSGRMDDQVEDGRRLGAQAELEAREKFATPWDGTVYNVTI